MLKDCPVYESQPNYDILEINVKTHFLRYTN